MDCVQTFKRRELKLFTGTLRQMQLDRRKVVFISSAGPRNHTKPPAAFGRPVLVHLSSPTFDPQLVENQHPVVTTRTYISIVGVTVLCFRVASRSRTRIEPVTLILSFIFMKRNELSGIRKVPGSNRFLQPRFCQRTTF